MEESSRVETRVALPAKELWYLVATESEDWVVEGLDGHGTRPPPFYQAGHDMGVESDTYAVGSMTMSHFLRVNFNLKSAILDFLLVIFN